jgi:hypothetical protein
VLGPDGTPIFQGPTSAGIPVAGAPNFGATTAAGGQGFALALAYTSTRIRPPRPGSTTLPFTQTGQQQLNFNLSFRPTSKWQANWTTLYDFNTQQFGQHYLRLERDLRRWHASFAFAKSPNGNFAFTFFVSLLDEPDIKFNYEQQTYPTTP